MTLTEVDPGSRSGDLLFSRLSAADHVTWFGLSWALDMANVHQNPLSSLSSVAIGTSTTQVCTVAFYIVRAQRAAASTYFTLTGWSDSTWQEAATAAEGLEARLVQVALRES